MKYLIFSDLHGSLEKTKFILDIFRKNKFDKMIFLGDLLYHGPRNDLPQTYNPREVAKLIKEYKEHIIFIKGNCDAEVDEMIIEASKPFSQFYTLKIGNKNFYFTHGHHLSKYNPDKKYGINDIIIYGHYHLFDIAKVNGATYINVGSITLPKDNIYGYATIDEKSIKLFDIENNLLKEYKFND